MATKRGRGRPAKLKAGETIKAIIKARGIKSEAARLLGVDWRTVDSMIRDHPTVAAAYKDATRHVVDAAQSGLLSALDAGERWAIERILDTYAESEDFALTGGRSTDPLVLLVTDKRSE